MSSHSTLWLIACAAVLALLLGALIVATAVFQTQEGSRRPEVRDTPFIGDTLQTIPIVDHSRATSPVTVLYTSSGFQPADVRVRVGSIVRFTNESDEDLWVRSAGEGLYPGKEGSCEASAFDSCRALLRGESWEFHVGEAGFWAYWNKANTAMKGVVRAI